MLLLGLLALTASVLAAESATAQLPDLSMGGAGGNVSGIARAGGRVYIGGSFRSAGTNLGSAVALDPSTGAILTHFPKVAGIVYAVAPDGAGGWYVGGALKGVGGYERSGVAHVLANGKVTEWNPHCDGRVLSLALRGSTLYVGGEFSEIGGEVRSNLAAIDVQSGMATEWNPGTNGPVHALLPSNTTIYVGGHFTSIAGSSRLSLAEIGIISGVATAWNPSPSFSGRAGTVVTLAVQNDTIYVGGDFGSLGGQYRLRAGSVNAVTGLATAWNPWPLGIPENRYDPADIVNVIVPAGPTVFVGGSFATIGGQPRGGLAEVDAVTGTATTWNPRTAHPPSLSDYNVVCLDIEVTEGAVFASGTWSYVGDVAQPCIAKLDRHLASRQNWNPGGDGLADVLATSGGVLVAAGRISQFGYLPRACLAAFDATTGELVDWAPQVEGSHVTDIVTFKGKVYIGGNFWAVNGQPRSNIAVVDASTGALLNWAPSINGNGVARLRVAEGSLYAVGSFTNVAGLPRSKAVSFDLGTGEVTNWDPQVASVGGSVFDIAIDGATAYLGGGFPSIAGVQRRFLAAVDAEDGRLLDWDPKPDGSVEAIQVHDNTLFIGGNFNVVGGQSRRRLAAVDARTGSTLGWSADAWNTSSSNSEVYALELSGTTLFVGGRFRTVGSAPRWSLAAVDVSTGQIRPWDAQVGDLDYPFSPTTIRSLHAHENALYVGGWFDYVGTTPVTDFAAVSLGPAVAAVPVSEARSPAAVDIFPNPVRTDARIRFSLLRTSTVSVDFFDLQGRKIESVVPSVAMPAGHYDLPFTAAGWREGFYFCRLEIDGRPTSRKLLVLRP